ncbi:MAG TPA: glycosyltransferase [Thermoplasmata archaeon]|nr:glycosyltransferase [Thermoplasmata archaeon]
MKVSVIVPTYQEARGIESFLAQFDRQTLARSEFEVIVVDGDSADGTREIAARHADRVLVQTSPGIGGARNDGVRIARADVIATTDADCRLPRDWLEHIVEDFQEPAVVAVCGPDGPFDGGRKARFIYFFVRGIIRLAALAGLYGTGGTNSAFRKDAFLAIGGYRNLPHSDDVDVGIRIRARGRIVYDPRLYVELSVRRLEKNGYLRTLFLWLQGDLKLLAGKPLEPKEYARQEY